jgi:2-iminobutanoate/2-iminopropanoate deaminase
LPASLLAEDESILLAASSETPANFPGHAIPCVVGSCRADLALAARFVGRRNKARSDDMPALRRRLHQTREAKMTFTTLSRISIGAAAATLFFGASVALQAKEFLKDERPQQRGYSLAVVTEGGKTVWLAGQTASTDDSGKSLAGDFDGQVRQLFKRLDATLQKVGGKLSDMVQMTVFITDVRNGDRFTQIRREVLGDNFPGSAMITITALADPNAKLEIQGYAVIGSK